MELYYLESPHIVNSEMLAIDDHLYGMLKPFIHSAFTREGIARFTRYLRAEHDAIIDMNRRILPAIISDPNFQKDLFGHEDECSIRVGHIYLYFRKIIQYVDDDYKF